MSPTGGPGEAAHSDFVQRTLPTAFLACFLLPFWHTFCSVFALVLEPSGAPAGFPRVPGPQQMFQLSSAHRATILHARPTATLQPKGPAGPKTHRLPLRTSSGIYIYIYIYIYLYISLFISLYVYILSFLDYFCILF